MKSTIALSLSCVFLFVSITFGQEDGFVPLFNGNDLSGWTAARGSGEGDWGAFSVNE